MWHPDEYHTRQPRLPATPAELAALADRVFAQTCRFTFDRPGFSLLTFTDAASAHATPAAASVALRQFMVDLKRELGRRLAARTGRDLHYFALGRFNQQVTTKFHLDGGPDESILMLGYEPSSIPSRLRMADYLRVARQHGMSTDEYLRDFNPMFREGETALGGTVTSLDDFDSSATNVVVVNNSRQGWDSGGLLGVMHQASIDRPDPEQPRIINSTLMGTVGPGRPEFGCNAEADHFVCCMPVAGPAAYG